MTRINFGMTTARQVEISSRLAEIEEHEAATERVAVAGLVLFYLIIFITEIYILTLI